MLNFIITNYFYMMKISFLTLYDPRTEGLLLMSSPLPTIAILALWLRFVFKWGPEYMKNREPLNLKYVMIAYNIAQVIANLYIVHAGWLARHVINWKCSEVDYSRSYWGMRLLYLTHMYYLLKMADLLDTVFFVLRKKTRHVSFLQVYHHFVMCLCSWIGTNFVGGGHSYFFGIANCIVHAILYGYYLSTSYDSKYSKLLGLKKFITQVQLFQFVFLLYTYGQLLFQPNCKFPKVVSYLIVPQGFFMIVLFGDFYIRTYHLEPKKRRNALDKKKEIQESLGKNDESNG